jgi:hypothetical protein
MIAPPPPTTLLGKVSNVASATMTKVTNALPPDAVAKMDAAKSGISAMFTKLTNPLSPAPATPAAPAAPATPAAPAAPATPAAPAVPAAPIGMKQQLENKGKEIQRNMANKIENFRNGPIGQLLRMGGGKTRKNVRRTKSEQTPKSKSYKYRVKV